MAVARSRTTSARDFPNVLVARLHTTATRYDVICVARARLKFVDDKITNHVHLLIGLPAGSLACPQGRLRGALGSPSARHALGLRAYLRVDLSRRNLARDLDREALEDEPADINQEYCMLD